MATGVTTQTGFNENPYITVAEYKNAPTSIDFNNLVVGGNEAAQNAELARVIMRATSYLNEYLNQDLTAVPTTQTQRVRINSMGFIALHPKISPILSLSEFYYGSTPNNLQQLTDCSVAWFEDQQIIIPLSQLQTTYSSQGPLAFGPNIAPTQQIFTRATFIGGYVNTLATGTATQSSITVVNPSGIIAGQTYEIANGASSEIVTVASNYTYGNTTVTLTAPLAFTHAAVSFGNMPTVIKQAAILMTTVFLRVRGDSSMTMNITTQPTPNPGNNTRYGSDVALALDMVNLYRRIR